LFRSEDEKRKKEMEIKSTNKNHFKERVGRFMGVSVQSLKGAKSIFIIKTNKKLLKRYSFCFNSKYKFYFEESAVTVVEHICHYNAFKLL
jgi:hypothetical protein